MDHDDALRRDDGQPRLTRSPPWIVPALRYGGAAIVGGSCSLGIASLVRLLEVDLLTVVLGLGIASIVALFGALLCYVAYRAAVSTVLADLRRPALAAQALNRPIASWTEDHWATVARLARGAIATVGFLGSVVLALAIATNATLLATLAANYLQVDRAEQQNRILEEQLVAEGVRAAQALLERDSGDSLSVELAFQGLRRAGTDVFELLSRLASGEGYASILARQTLADLGRLGSLSDDELERAVGQAAREYGREVAEVLADTVPNPSSMTQGLDSVFLDMLPSESEVQDPLRLEGAPGLAARLRVLLRSRSDEWLPILEAVEGQAVATRMLTFHLGPLLWRSEWIWDARERRQHPTATLMTWRLFTIWVSGCEEPGSRAEFSAFLSTNPQAPSFSKMFEWCTEPDSRR